MTAGRQEDITDAIAACDHVLTARPNPSDSARASLGVTRDLLEARLSRVVERPFLRRDGAVEVKRWHHPGSRAHRLRPMRFVRP